MSELFELRIGMVTSEEEAQRILEQVQLLLCPDPDHAPPCPIPWDSALLSGDAVDPEDHESITTQWEIEWGGSPG